MMRQSQYHRHNSVQLTQRNQLTQQTTNWRQCNWSSKKTWSCMRAKRTENVWMLNAPNRQMQKLNVTIIIWQRVPTSQDVLVLQTLTLTWPSHPIFVVDILRTAITGVFRSVTGLIAEIQMPKHHVNGTRDPIFENAGFPCCEESCFCSIQIKA